MPSGEVSHPIDPFWTTWKRTYERDGCSEGYEGQEQCREYGSGCSVVRR